MRITEELVEVFRITERRGGQVYKTKSLGYTWVIKGSKPEDTDLQYISPSTSVPWPWVRTREE